MGYSIEKDLDGLGRIVLPKSMREHYGIAANGRVAIIPTEKGILIVNARESNHAKNDKRKS